MAIKVLPQEMASDSDRLRRFEQEARAASALNHPNIVTIHEIGEHDGTPYSAMEYVHGVTLREMLMGGAERTALVFDEHEPRAPNETLVELPSESLEPYRRFLDLSRHCRKV